MKLFPKSKLYFLILFYAFNLFFILNENLFDEPKFDKIKIMITIKMIKV